MILSETRIQLRIKPGMDALSGSCFSGPNMACISQAGGTTLEEPIMQVVDANGAKIPSIGLGTWELRGRVCARVVEQAIKLGYRHIDTAQVYENEREVGEGLRASGIKRDEVFVTTKVWTTHFAPNDLERSTKESLARLRMTEVDLLLLHWPNPHVPLEETLGALAHVRAQGLARHIGLSNFTVELIEQAIRISSAPLVCDQVEYHPFLGQSKVLDACQRHGMALVAYSPIAKGQVKGDEKITRIGEKYGKTAAQVCLRWLVQQNVVAIPRTSKVERLSENLSIFDFELSDDDMKEIFSMGSDQGRLTNFAFAPKWD
jgi:2,5-diketo-D-gluconate reductase B